METFKILEQNILSIVNGNPYWHQQPRDDLGRWAETGGPGSLKSKAGGFAGNENGITADPGFFGREHDAISFYADNGFLGVNQKLRQGKVDYDNVFVTDTTEYDDTIAALDSAMKKSVAERDLTVYRHVNEGDWPEVFGHLEVGSTFHDNGFMSTTNSKEALSDFAGDGSGDISNISHLEIKVPKGTKALDFNNSGADIEYESEQEILLDRGLRMTVLEKSGNRLVVAVTGTRD